MRRVLAFCSASILVVTACGGGSETGNPVPNGSSTAPIREVIVPDVTPEVAEAMRVTAEAAIDRFEDMPTAGAALIAAYDRGYSFDQISDGVASGQLDARGTIAGTEPELALGNPEAQIALVGSVSDPSIPQASDTDAIKAALVLRTAEFVGAIGGPWFFLWLLLGMMYSNLPPDALVEAVVFGEFTESTIAKIEEQFDTPDEPGNDTAGTEPVDQVEPSISGGLLDYSLIPGDDGTMHREAITLSVDGDSATLAFDLRFTTPVEYDDDIAVCSDNFTFTAGASDLTVDGDSVSGTVELILDFDGGTQCPGTVQDDIGVPQSVDITGTIDDNAFVGDLLFEGFSIPFSAAVG